MFKIAGPSQIPADSLDIYFGPLMEELQQLWKGVNALDASRSTISGPSHFKLRAALFCTMHDWPGKVPMLLNPLSFGVDCMPIPCRRRVHGRFTSDY